MSKFPKESKKAVLLGRDDREFIYYQLSARKDQLTFELTCWAHKKSTEEILAVSDTINKIDKAMTKLMEG